jgi:hypothetical protein
MNEITLHEQGGQVMTAADVRSQINLIQEVMRGVMKVDVHYGTIPGTGKPSLWKPGAEVLCATFRIAASYRTEDLSTDDYVRYRVTCIGTHQGSGVVMGEGIGEASSNEQKYKWVKCSNREWEATPENRRRVKYMTSRNGDYEIKQVRTEPADVANTILKMAAKRAQVAMTLNVTAASDIFTQDIEDLPEGLQTEEGAGQEPKRTPKPKQPAPGTEQREPAKEPAESPLASEGMIKFMVRKLGEHGKTPEAALEKFTLKSFDGITVAQANAVIDWANGGQTA